MGRNTYTLGVLVAIEGIIKYFDRFFLNIDASPGGFVSFSPSGCRNDPDDLLPAIHLTADRLFPVHHVN